MQPKGSVSAQNSTPVGARPITPWLIGLGAVGAVALILFGLSAAGLLRFGSREPETKVLRAQGQDAQPDLLRARGQDQGPALVQSTTPEAIKMPPDVRAWLEHLERIEKEKNLIHRRQAIKLQASMSSIAAKVSSAGAQAMMDENASEVPDLDLSDIIPVDAMIAEWEVLRAKLNTVRPPAECYPLYQSYHGSLVNIAGEIAKLKDIGSDLYGILQSGKQDQAVKSAEGVGAAHSSQVDQLLLKSDEQLGEICGKYNEKKWFEIKTDLGGSMTQFGF